MTLIEDIGFALNAVSFLLIQKLLLEGENIMLSLIFAILMLMIFGKILIFAIKAAWGITKICFSVIFLPIVLICLVFAGLLYIALPLLIVIGIISLVATRQ